MNKINQIREAEHNLKLIDGNSISSTKKKLTNALDSTDGSYQGPPYSKPSSYSAFLSDISTACSKGNDDSKTKIESLAPDMAALLKSKNEWENPKVGVEHSDVPAGLILQDLSSSTVGNWPSSSNHLDELIKAHLGEISSGNNIDVEASSEEGDISQALCNLITDLDVSEDSTCDVRKSLKELQPHREQPSKDRRRRFAYAPIPGDSSTNSDHDLVLYQYWAIQPTNKTVQRAKCFLVGQVICITLEGKVVQSGIKTNKNVQVMLSIYSYSAEECVYNAAGKSSLCRADKVLLIDITSEVHQVGDNLRFDYKSLPSMESYIPYHEDVDIDSRVLESSCEEVSEFEEEQENDDDDDPYIVERIIHKRFHPQRNQYEFLVKWRGYSETENTWELASNIPSEVLNNFEKDSRTEYVSRSGRASKHSHRHDYVQTF